MGVGRRDGNRVGGRGSSHLQPVGTAARSNGAAGPGEVGASPPCFRCGCLLQHCPTHCHCTTSRMNLQSHGMPHCLLFMQYQPWSPMHRRRQLESAALSLASGVHAMSLSWVQATWSAAARRPGKVYRLFSGLRLCAVCQPGSTSSSRGGPPAGGCRAVPAG